MSEIFQAVRGGLRPILVMISTVAGFILVGFAFLNSLQNSLAAG